MVSTTDFGSASYRSSRYTSTSLTDKLAYSIMAITSDSGPDDGGSIPSMPTTSTISTTVSTPDFQSGYACSIQVLCSLLISWQLILIYGSTSTAVS